jgi:hypothetical protein
VWTFSSVDQANLQIKNPGFGYSLGILRHQSCKKQRLETEEAPWCVSCGFRLEAWVLSREAQAKLHIAQLKKSRMDRPSW